MPTLADKRITNAGAALVALAALFWGLSGGIGGVLVERGWDASVISLYRGGTGMLFVFVWLALRPQRSGLSDRHLWFWSIAAGAGVAANFLMYFIAVTEGSVAIAATLVYCAPVFVYLISFAIGLERPTPVKWSAIAIVMMGVLLLTGVYDIEDDKVSVTAVGAGLLSGLAYTAFIFSFKYAAPRGSPQAILSITFATLVIILIVAGDGQQARAVAGSGDWPLFVALGVLGAGLSFVAYVIGLNQTSPATASIIAMVEPVTAALFGVCILNESLTALQLAGAILILSTVTLLSIYSGAGVPPTRFGHELRRQIALRTLRRAQ